ncbi:hypothetical protein LINGRAHAP2_LOCUS23844 [Linum grandiflorum]
MVANYHPGPWVFLSLVKPFSFFFQATPLIPLPSSRPGLKSNLLHLNNYYFLDDYLNHFIDSD